MSRFQVVLIRPEGFQDTEAFREVAETVQFGLRSLGHAVVIRENAFDVAATNVLLGAHLLSPAHAKLLPPGSIIFNLEQLERVDLSRAYYWLAARHRIWDYSRRNLERWKAVPCAFPPLHVPVGYAPPLRRIPRLPSEQQDIDVLFYGSVNERRKRIIEQLRAAGVRVHAVYGVYGEERDRLIARSRIVLNIHYWEEKLFEIVRISYLLANSKAVVSESSPDELEQEYRGAFLSAPYDSVVESCLALLRDETQRRQLEERGFQRFSRDSMSGILHAALAGNSGRDPAVSISTPYSPTLNAGSGCPAPRALPGDVAGDRIRERLQRVQRALLSRLFLAAGLN